MHILLSAFATIALFMPAFMIFAVWLLKKNLTWCLRDVADASTGPFIGGRGPLRRPGPIAGPRSLRVGMPYASAGNWSTGEGFSIRTPHALEWLGLVGAHVEQCNDKAALRALRLDQI
jgi:hypothetical protein